MDIRPSDVGILMAANESRYLTVSTPAFSTLLSRDSTSAYGQILARVMDGTEPSIGGSNALDAALIFTVWRRARLPTEHASSSSDNPPLVATTKGDAVLIFAASNQLLPMGITVPSGYTPISSEFSRGRTRAWAGYAAKPSVPAEDPPSLDYFGFGGNLAFSVVVPRN